MENTKRYRITKYVMLCTFALFYLIMAILISTGTYLPKTNQVGTLITIQFSGIAISLLPLLLEWIFKIRFTVVALIIYSVFCFSAMGLGSGFGMYNIFPRYDFIVHSFSGVVVAFLSFSVFSKIIRQDINLKNRLIFTFLFTFCFTVLIGVLWETWEFATDHFFNLNSQRHSLFDGTELSGHNAVINTMLDLIADSLGGLVASGTIAIFFYIKKQEPINLLSIKHKKAKTVLPSIVKIEEIKSSNFDKDANIKAELNDDINYNKTKD